MRSATRTAVSALGVYVALAGFEHGIGEVLQGNVAPDGLVIESWPGSAFFRIVAGEPAMTVIPNLLVTGILAIIVSLIFVVWATRCVQSRNSAVVMVLLSVVMLLVGGGFGPPLLGIIVAAAATKIDRPLPWWHAHLSAGLRQSLARLWPWFFGACLVSWLMLFPGSSILGYFFGVTDTMLVPAIFLCALSLLVLTVLSGFAYDLERQTVTVGQQPTEAR